LLRAQAGVPGSGDSLGAARDRTRPSGSSNGTAAVSATALLRGSRLGWQVLLGYGVLGILWCIATLVF